MPPPPPPHVPVSAVGPLAPTASGEAVKARLAALQALIHAQTHSTKSRRRNRDFSWTLPSANVPCKFFLQGRCTSNKCRFLHQRPAKVPKRLSTDDATRLQQLRRLIGQRRQTTVPIITQHSSHQPPPPVSSFISSPTAVKSQRQDKSAIASSSDEMRASIRLNQLQALLSAHKKSSLRHSDVRTKWIRDGLSIARSTKRRVRPGLCRRGSAPVASKRATSTISINGVEFKLHSSGRKMTRVDATEISTQPSVPRAGQFVPTHINVAGVAYIKAKGGKSLVRSSMQNSRVQATSRLKRSLAVARNRSRDKRYDKREKEFCMFFNRFGKCKAGEKCIFIHDPSKVSVCRLFLAGKCFDDSCLLSHSIDREKMPVCSFFLRGMCDKGSECPYSHVRVNPSANVCPRFLKGFCPDGDSCKLKHMYPKQQRKASRDGRVPHSSSSSSSKPTVCPGSQAATRVIDDSQEAGSSATTAADADSSASPIRPALRIRPRLSWTEHESITS